MKSLVRPEALTVAAERKPEPADEGGEYLKVWHEKESLNGTPCDAFVIILRTSGCYWAHTRGCTMCGYARETLGREATEDEILSQVAKAMTHYRDEPYVKIYTSGSFLDPHEVPPAARLRVAKAFSGRARRLLFESLPEFVTPEAIDGVRKGFEGEVEVALGLETTQDDVLQKAVTKVSTVEEYLGAARRLRDLQVLGKAYLLLKPPFLTERQAIEDTVLSIGKAKDLFQTISVNPVHIQGGTLVERLWRRELYRPPWLWSLREVLLRGKESVGDAVRLVSFPTSGGNPRGVHNCLTCDGRVLRAIERATLSQDFEPLRKVAECTCIERWRWENSLEYLAP